ncbi:hypothetical protein EVAR_74897_1 [Eumeta japonica]|uniref:Uncharacterized protein n=1 Tax=Eumeta variegata TaxID=151549 RepID=A0A4C1Z4U3_EUMVA|nr:hypothetical protein EVAR_74897_1 [Eumeta japonica]
MVWLVVAGKPDHSTPSNVVELGDGRLNVNPVNRLTTDDEKWIIYDKNVRKRSWLKDKQSPQTIAKPG